MRMHAAAKEGQSIVAAEMETLIAAASAADCLQPGKIKKLKWSDLVKYVELLEQQGHELPISCARAVSRKHAETLLEYSQWADWCNVSRPWQLEDDATPAWTISLPILRAASPGAEEDQGNFADSFLGTFFNDTGLRLIMAHQHSSGTAGNPSGLQNALETFLNMYEDWDADGTALEGHAAQHCIKPFLSALRGMSALISPVPGKYGATAADVEFVMPSSSAKPPATDAATMELLAPPASKVIFTHMRDSAMWKQLRNDFTAVAAAEAVMSPAIFGLMDKVAVNAAAGDMAGFGHLIQSVQEAASKLPEFRASLRPGATSQLEGLLMTALQKAIDDLAGNATTSMALTDRMAMYARIRDILQQGHLQGTEAMLQTVNSTITGWQATDNMSALEQALRKPLQTPEDIGAFLAAVKAAEGLDVPPSTSRLLSDARGLIFKAMTSCLDGLSAEATTVGAVDVYLHAIDVLNKLPGLPGAPEEKKVYQTAPNELAKRVIALKMSHHVCSAACHSGGGTPVSHSIWTRRPRRMRTSQHASVNGRA